jgi:APA family basic amino acid/polyamine antiporter
MDQHRRMGLPRSIALVMGQSIALGIFAMAKSLGAPLLLAIPFLHLFGLAIVLCGDPIRRFFFCQIYAGKSSVVITS